MKNKEIEELLNELKEVTNSKKLSSTYCITNKHWQLLLSYIEQLQTTAKDCKQKLDQYENPDDLTLFYMWLDEKAKDKIKQLEKENEFLKLDNPSANMKHFEMLKENKRKIDNLRYQNKQLKNNRDKAIEYLEKSKLNQLDTHCLHINFSTDEIENIDELIDILKGDSNDR